METDNTQQTEAERRIALALEYIYRYGSIDGGHHKQWVLDQAVRALTGCPTIDGVGTDGDLGESDEYRAWVQAAKAGEYGPDSYDWDTGIAP